MAEVLVIGGGMAGAIAALAARARGARVVLARRALGATALSSGAIDVAPDPRAVPGELKAQLVDYEASAREVAKVRPWHPYAVLESRLHRLGEALRFASEQLPELLAPPSGRNGLFPTPLGTVKPAATVQRSQAADLATLPERIAVVDFAINPAHDPRLVARGLEAAAARLGRPLSAEVVVSQFFRYVEDALRLPHELAARFDEPGAVEALAEELGRALPPRVGAVLFPPVLGRRTLDVAARLSARLGIPCLELLSEAPSVPGLRLQDALDRALARAGVERVDAEVDGSEARQGRYHLGGGRVLSPTSVVLATGKYIGGGIVRRDRFLEPLLGLPVFDGDRVLVEEYVGGLLADELEGEQAAFRAGVRIDASLRPVGEDGAPVFPRIYAAGAVIGGFDAASDKTGLGVAIFTGYLAGEAAAAGE